VISFGFHEGVFSKLFPKRVSSTAWMETLEHILTIDNQVKGEPIIIN
jgi:hypothetical protein